MTRFCSSDAQMIGNFILLKSFAATLTADMNSVDDAKQTFHNTLLDALIDLDPNEFPDELADTIRTEVKDYIQSFLDTVSVDVEQITNQLLITETPRSSVAEMAMAAN